MSYSAVCAQINSALEVRTLMEYVAWYPRKVIRQGDVYRALCPIHQETLFRTLVLNPRNNTYQCEHGQCPGNQAADFLDLLTKVYNKTIPEVLKGLVDHFGPEYFRLTERQLALIDRLVDEVKSAAEQNE